MRICHVQGIFSPEHGGPTVSLQNYCSGLVARGHSVSLRVVDGYHGVSDAVRMPAPVDQFTGRICGVNMFAPSPSLRAKLREDPSPDLYHLHGAWVMPPLYGCREARRRRVPYIIEVMGHYEPWPLRLNWWIKVLMRAAYQDRILREAACIHVNSRQEARNLSALGFAGPFAVIPVGVDMVAVEAAQRSLAGVVPDKLPSGNFFLYLARLDDKKGIRLLLKVWAEIRSRHPDWKLVVCGAGKADYVESLKAFIALNGMERQCLLLGHVEEDLKAWAFSQAAFYVLPTNSENFGNSVTEALAFGCPVLTTVHTPWAALQEHRCGWLTQTDPRALTAALVAVLTTPRDTLRGMGARGRELVEKRYSLKSVIEALESTYAWILGAPRPEHVVDG